MDDSTDSYRYDIIRQQIYGMDGDYKLSKSIELRLI